MKTHRSTQLFLEVSVSGGGVFVQYWKCRQAKKDIEAWFVCWWLRMVRRAIMSKRPGMLSDRILLLHDNARPHTANLVRDKLQRLSWQTLHPPYIPDLSPCAFQIFDYLKEDMRGRRFHSDEEVQEWVRLWIHQRLTFSVRLELIVSPPCELNVLALLTTTFE